MAQAEKLEIKDKVAEKTKSQNIKALVQEKLEEQALLECD